MADPARLDDAEVGQRLARLDELLERVETVPGPATEAAVEAVQALTEVYGEALARAADLVRGAGPEPAERFLADELLGHLLVLHDLHPDPVEQRAARAVDGLRDAVRERGGELEFAGIEDGEARVRLTLKGCGSSTGPVEEAVREAVLAAAPELSGVRRVPEERQAAFVPLDALARPSVAAGGPA
ncbi:NifU family protein [Streptomyces sp. JJ36]|uniref:NifU family protein n=1 Tax=Streptomyces sp. JJ36 TaxID=2736645 RepID=UPI001EFFF42B|nr:NifU family protein [Streptomyces sp. JJ36]MCF6521945.1 NifU family protein [Streptomyces sp. JJ36]